MRAREGEDQPRTEASPGRRPYEPPRILFREPLESVAANCSASGGKADLGQCPQGPLQS